MDSVQVKTEVKAGPHMGDTLATDWELYNLICDHEDCTVYVISKHLNLPTSKTTQSVKRLIRAKMVRKKEKVVSGRSVEVIAPVKWTEHFTEAELEQIKSKV